MDPMTAGRKIRLHLGLLEWMEFKEGSLHICCDCFNYNEQPILWFINYRFYPYCISCMQVYFRKDKIDYLDYFVTKKRTRHACYGSRA